MGVVSEKRLRAAVRKSKGLIQVHGRNCKTTTEQLMAWFKADTPYEDGTLDDIIDNQYLIVHELVEIEEVLRMGLRINKRTIIDNLEKVDEAHLEATKMELRVAAHEGDFNHIRSRLRDIEMWISDPAVTPPQRREYARLLAAAKKTAHLRPSQSRPRTPVR